MPLRLIQFVRLAAVLSLAACSRADPPGEAARASPPPPRKSTAAAPDLQTLDQVLARSMNRFAELDLNRDGKLTPDELAKDPHPADLLSFGPSADGVVTRAQAEAQTREQFKRLDGDHDGKVSRAEIMAAFRRRGDSAASR